MKVHVLPLGAADLDVAKFLPWEPERGERHTGPIFGFLIQTADGTNILVDTGLAPEHLEDPECRTPQPDIVVAMTAEDNIRHRLSEVGLTPDDIDYVVQTHFDFDHCGGNRLAAGSIFVVQRDQYEYAKANPSRCPPQDWDLPELTYQLVDGDHELVPGVELVVTPGHAPGHQSVIVRGLRDAGTIILSGDAAHTYVEIEEERMAGSSHVAEMLASMRKLKRIRDAENATLLLSHESPDGKLSPAYYE